MPGQGRGAERGFIEPAAAIKQAAAIAREHFDISQKMVAEGDGLRGLQMGEAGHGGGCVLGGAGGQGQHQVCELGVQRVDRVPHPEAKIGGDLVVAAAGGVQAAAGIADAVGQARLDIHVDVFQRLVHGKAPDSISAAMADKPVAMAASSADEMMPTWASMAAWAREPAISWRQSFWSKATEALICRMMVAGAVLKRPAPLDVGGPVAGAGAAWGFGKGHFDADSDRAARRTGGLGDPNGGPVGAQFAGLSG